MRETVKLSNTGIAFISFQEQDVAEELVEESDVLKYNVDENDEMKPIGEAVGIEDWEFEAAQLPLDLVWANLDIDNQLDVLSGNFGILLKKMAILLI